jgi:sortase A
MKRVLELTGSLLVFVAFAALIWSGAFVLRAHLEQIRASAVLNREAVIHSADRLTVNSVQPHGLLGRIDIPRIGVSSVVLEGDDKDTLALSVGHVPGTALPGSDGNVALAAHRDTFFRGLEHIRAGDEIRLTSLGSDRAYRVDSTRVVAPTDVYVLKETGSPILTLVTCYPFHYVGPAPKRFIVQAQLIRP